MDIYIINKKIFFKCFFYCLWPCLIGDNSAKNADRAV